MPRAWILIKAQPHYRRDAFESGLAKLGYAVQPINQIPRNVSPGDVIVSWNRTGSLDVMCSEASRRGAKVLIAENGYIGKDDKGQQLYALARDGHNGSGRFHVEPDEDRWGQLGIELKPWRDSGDHIVIFAQRGIGSPMMASPRGWELKMAEQLKTMTKRKVVVSPHPGKPACSDGVTKGVQDLLRNAHAAVVWASARGVRALAEGIPVFYAAPHWIAAPAARYGLGVLEKPDLGDRLPAFQRLAHAQWTLSELVSGEPFARLLK